MRRLTSIMGIMLLSLLLSGWGEVFAAAFCPHLASENRATKIEAPSCHSEEAQQSSPISHQAMGEMEMTPAAQSDHDKVLPVGQFRGTCSHCMEKNSSPLTVVNSRELSSQKPDAGGAIEDSATALVSPTVLFQPKFIATQNAPPGAANRKHLLLSVFLI